MAQPSSAQREPSMEEILASIRRIIEDSDAIHGTQAAETVRADNDVAAGAAVAVLNGRSVEDPAVIEVDAFRAELRSLPASPEPQSHLRAAISLSDVQAQVAADQIAARAAAEQAYRDVAVSSRSAAPEPAVAPQAETSLSVSTRPVEPLEWTLDAALLAQELSSLTQSDEDSAFEAAIEVAVHDFADAAIAPVSQTVAPEVASAVQPLLSDHAGKQVKAAFGELSEAFAARSKRSLDDLAAEMLRPMLQEWLDNNLPLLVEKLVREEIERVARGS